MSASDPSLHLVQDFVHVWGRDELKGARAIVEHDALTTGVAAIEASLRRAPARSTLLIGAPGVGKTSYTLILARRLRKEGGVVFEATASDLMAGQSYVGQIDERIKNLVQTMRSSPKILWVCPSFHELVWAGRHSQSPIGILEMLLPHLESGALRIVGETSPAAYELMIRLVPKLRSVMEPLRIEAADSELTQHLAVERFSGKSRAPIPRDVIREGARLIDQFLLARENPGRLLDVLETTKQRLLTEAGSTAPVTLDDVLTTVSARTGLPVEIIDDRRQMNLAEVRSYFESRILGQQEAVSAVVERISLTKAGLTDPTRPLAVFLFVGPTGTGKTEIAKALATYFFQSPSRLLRYDMSELVDPSALDRLLGVAGAVADPSALVTRIRENPFSVILLDEFEKAHPIVWDLFLQLFDDGRLTSRDGSTADFRNAIIIMTSNLGAADAHSSGLGFANDGARFEPSTIRRTLETTFRPEFINRIDRVVVFQPLSRPVMRKLLDIELKSVYERRGLRRRGWAIEWDEAALEHLLDQGFSPTLGARPLKRAVERLFLAPLAEVIVEHRAPEGEQFLFVRLKDGRLDVEFVDPDAPAEASAFPPASADASRPHTLESVALDGEGRASELTFLAQRYGELVAHTTASGWAERKAARLAAMSESGFWERPDRFLTLGLAEYMDRAEAALRTAGSLLQRLRHTSTAPRALVRRLGELLYLIREATEEIDSGALGEVFLQVRAAHDPQRTLECNQAARQLATMYRRWAEKRRMKVQVLAEGQDAGGRWECLLGISGFGSQRILERETGQHVFERATGPESAMKIRAAVLVAPQPSGPAEGAREAERTARRLLEEAFREQPTTIVRRYRDAPDALVRDAGRGWRSGNLAAVLDGDFDLMG
ncbi:MAG: AAA family ATPase [Gemmatimonadota bacterium]